MVYKIVLDGGHGGRDFGNTNGERLEKDDTLKLVLAVGSILEEYGIEVEYTRTDDVYNTPYEKALMANNSGANLFISLHRNISGDSAQKGVEVLVYNNSEIRSVLAEEILSETEKLGFHKRGIKEKPDLPVLKHTKMPAVLVEVGFLSSQEDNSIFDKNFSEIAAAIVQAFLNAINADVDIHYEEVLYRVQLGAFRSKDNAYRMMEHLRIGGYQSFIIFENGYYKVQVGAYRNLENAVIMERTLRKGGYTTFIATH